MGKRRSFTSELQKRKQPKSSAVAIKSGKSSEKKTKKPLFQKWTERVNKASVEHFGREFKLPNTVTWEMFTRNGAYTIESSVTMLGEAVIRSILEFEAGRQVPELPLLHDPSTWHDVKSTYGWFQCASRVFGQQVNHIPPKKGPRREVFAGKDPYELRDGVITYLKNAVESGRLTPHRLQVELGQKFSPCHFGGFGALHETLDKQYRASSASFDATALKQAVNDILDEIDFTQYSVLRVEQAASFEESDPELSAMAVLYENTAFKSNSGWPYYVRSENLGFEEVEFHIFCANAILNGKEGIADYLQYAPSVLFKRSQMGRKKDGVEEAKTRAVMGVPMFTKLAGGCFWYPLLDRMRRVERYYSYKGNHHLHDVVGKCLEADYTVSLDFESYDTTIYHVFDALFENLIERCLDGRVDFVKPEDRTRAVNLLKWEREYYFNCPLINPLGITFGRHGLFSGLIGTSFGGSLCNAVSMRYAEIQLQRKVDRSVRFVGHCTMGDDTILGIHSCVEVTLDNVIDCLEELGLRCTRDTDKQWWCGPDTPDEDRGVVFLSRYWYQDRRQPEFSLVRALGNILWGEKLTREEEIIRAAGATVAKCSHDTAIGPVLLRIVSSLMNTEHHPLCKEFVRFVMTGSPHHLAPLSWMGLTHLLRVYGAHIDLENVQLHGIAAHPVAQYICEYYDRCVARGETRIPNDNEDEFIVLTLDELAAAADAKRAKADSDNPQVTSVDEIVEAVKKSGLAPELINSILNKLPK